jgi:hypothetical protein
MCLVFGPRPVDTFEPDQETANRSYYCWHKAFLGKHDSLQLQTPHGHKPSPTGLTHPLTVAYVHQSNASLMQPVHPLLATVAHAAATTEAFGPRKNITNTVQHSGSCCTFKSGPQALVKPASTLPSAVLAQVEHEPAKQGDMRQG